MSATIDGIEFHGDATAGAYEVLRSGARLIKGVPGLTCEIGVRTGLGSVLIMEACQNNDDKRIHVGVDPWGNVEYVHGDSARRADYTNSMKREALKNVYNWCHMTKQECLLFIMKDTEFFDLFANGIPIHEQESRLVNEYAYIFVDGPHNVAAVQTTTEFFEPRSPIGAIWQFDNTNVYAHAENHEWIVNHGFVEITADIGNIDLTCRLTYQRTSK